MVWGHILTSRFGDLVKTDGTMNAENVGKKCTCSDIPGLYVSYFGHSLSLCAWALDKQHH